jgi:large subunit ribosomal protein L35
METSIHVLFNKKMRRPKTTKTRKAVAKRFKVTATGKIKRTRSGKRHLLQHKSPKQRKRLGTSTLLDDGDRDRIILNLPFSNRK